MRRPLAGLSRRAGRYLAPTLHGYRRDLLVPDLLAALTLLAIAIPEQLATAHLAGMPPIAGLYAFIAGSVCFALLGADRTLSVGADSTIAPLFAVGVAGLAATGSPRYAGLVGILAVMVGTLVAVVGLLRLGWVAQFLSTPIISGFLAGVAVIIVVHQLPGLLGTPDSGGSMVHRLHILFADIASTNLWSLGIGVAVLALALLAEHLDRRLPAALAALVGSAALVGLLGLQGRGVEVVGPVRPQIPSFGLVDLSGSALVRLGPLAAVVALVVISQSAATTRAFADPSDSDDVDRDFLAVGAGSVLAGLSGSFPVNASPPRTAATKMAGGRTQAASLVAAASMAALIPAAGLLRDVPLATLAAVLVFVAVRMFHARDLLRIARFSRFEAGLAGVAALTVALVGVQQGIGVAVALAILDRARLDARPQLHVLGRVPGTTSFAPLSGGEQAAQVPGLLVVLFSTPLWYANALHFRAEMEAALGRAVGQPRAVVLDAIGMSDIDYTGMQALEQVVDLLGRRHIRFVVARAGERARSAIAASGITDTVGPANFYGTVWEAAMACSGPPLPGGPDVTISSVGGRRPRRRSSR